MAEAHSKIGRIRGQGVLAKAHPGVAEQPLAAWIVELNAPMSLPRWPCQSSDPRLRLSRKSWMMGHPAGLHWKRDRVAFAAWKPCLGTAVLKEKMYYAKLWSNSYASQVAFSLLFHDAGPVGSNAQNEKRNTLEFGNRTLFHPKAMMGPDL